MTSPEGHPISGLNPPQNTPKTAASSPRLTAINTHNQDVADAFSDYVNNMNGRPLSESIWAPGSTRYKHSMLSGARSANVLTSVNAVKLDSAVNDTFDRMTFKAADSHHKNDENIIGEQNIHSLFSKAPPSFVNKCSLLDVQNKTSDEDLEPSAHAETVDKDQAKVNRASEKELANTAHTDRVEKENNASSTSKAYLPPHLRAIRDSSQKPVKTETNPSPHLRAIRDSSRKPVKTETNPSTIITGSVDAKPLTDAPSRSEDLEHEIFFNTWPKLEERSRPGEFRRTFVLLWVLTHKQPPRCERSSSKTSLAARQLRSLLH